MLDRGIIDAGDRSRPLCEIELELKRGKVAEVFDIAGELIRAVLIIVEELVTAFRFALDGKPGAGKRKRRASDPGPARAAGK
jgi:inorganic triphosphatase YgiF